MERHNETTPNVKMQKVCYNEANHDEVKWGLVRPFPKQMG